MPSATTDRRRGLTADKGIKAPVDIATTANIVLSGEQTIDGVLTAASRVLVKNQTVTTQNGLYDSSSAGWTRCIDSNGNGDLVKGQLVAVTGGTQAGTYWHITSANPITIDTSAIVFAQDLTNTSSALAASLANTADPAQGDALIGMKRTQVATVATNLHLWLEAQIINVKSDGGCAMDGVTDDTVALQAVADALNTFQNAQVTAQKLTKAVVFFPDGNLKLSDRVKWHGFVALLGTGAAYTGGSVIRQTGESKNAFEFYGSANDHTSLGTTVDGLNFEFTTVSTTGYALYYPRNDDVVPANVLSSNSHYIKNNRFGGWHANGRFLYMASCGDVEITGNCVDVCPSHAMVFGDQTFAGPFDVRISQNEFFFCLSSIVIYSGHNFAIHGNNFSTAFNGAGWAAIRTESNTATITAGTISSVAIVGNSFLQQYNCWEFDGSANNITYADNTHYQCWNAPLRGPLAAAPNAARLDIRGNTFHLDATYPLAYAPLQFAGGGLLTDSTIADNSVDANGVNAVVSFCNDNTTTSFLGTGLTWRNNIIRNNTSYEGANKTFIPVNARELVIENSFSATAAAFLTNQAILNFNTIAVADYFTFELAWEVTITKVGVNAATRAGVTRVSVVRWNATLAGDCTVVSSVASDFSGTGATAWPVVTWAVSTGGPAALQLTVTNGGGGGITANLDTSVKVRASNFRASSICAALIKSA